MLLREPAATADSSCVADILPTLAPPPQCPNLRELDLSECRLLTDAVFESLGAGAGPSGYLGGGELNPGGWVGVWRQGLGRGCTAASWPGRLLHLNPARDPHTAAQGSRHVC